MKVSTSVISRGKEGEIEFEKPSCKSISSGNHLRWGEGRDISYYVFLLLGSSQGHILGSISRIWYHHGHWQYELSFDWVQVLLSILCWIFV